ncbi:MAG: DNA-binding response regulator [Rhodothermaceae bacterium]|nr:DNA-binding response regulator [Rhodothermaceae bacterium]MBC13771.1 DNA-binding response regulator [Rhodothermaceae bacterium]
MLAPIRVVLVDDHPPMRSGIRALIEREAERGGWAVEIVGEAGTAERGLDLVRSLSPNVVVTDLDLPAMSGVDLARAIHEEALPTRVLVLSAYDDAAYLHSLQSCGVAGFLTKEKPAAVIAEAVRAVSRGETRWFVMPPEDALAELTDREAEVLRSLAGGRSNTEIADELDISEHTVRNHLTNVYEKLDLTSSREAVAWAWKHGIGEK